MLFNRILLIFVVPALLLVPVFASGEAPAFHWTGQLAPEQQLTIKNIGGSISIESVEGETVEVTAIVTSGNPNQVHIEVMQSKGMVAVCTINANAQGASREACRAETQWCRSECDGVGPRVDFIVGLPRSVRLLNLEGVNTSITGRFSMQQLPDEMNIRTVSGNIELQLPANLSVNFDVLAPGRHLRSEFPAIMQHAYRVGCMKGTIGKRKSKLRISTVSGRVSLKKIASPELETSF